MIIEKAREMGLCSGVRRAIALLERFTAEKGPLESLGSVAHNRKVVERLSHSGVTKIENLSEVKGGIVAIPSHGVGPQVLEEIRARGLKIVDATCPVVRKAQRVAQGLAEAGFFVIIFGDAHHPEVRGVLGWAGVRGVATREVPSELPRRLGLLCQTTETVGNFTRFAERVVASALGRASEVRIVNTICTDIRRRQQAAAVLARRADLMIVIGGRDSANTKRLAEISAAAGAETRLVESAAELEPSWTRDRRRIGVTAGASTPGEVIEEVVSKLREMASS